jgi:hypothetical protein
VSGDWSADATGGMSGDGRWMTYAELAEHRGISRPSAERLVLRKRWRRQRGNDRTVRILVPRDSLSGDMTDDTAGILSDDASADTSSVMSGDTTDHRALLSEALVVLEGALTEANKRAEAALALAADANARADRAEARADAAENDRRRADALVASLEADLRAKGAETAQHRVAAAQARTEARDATEAARIATDALKAARQAEEARKGRGRLRRAWDGWRGR